MRLFVNSVLATAPRVVLLIVAATLALGSNMFVMDGPDVADIKASSSCCSAD